jgi:hypothetical protein
MRKVQILFPEPQLKRLREVARREDRPLSEVVRRAAEAYLERLPAAGLEPRAPVVPVFDGGEILVGPEEFRELAHAERAGAATGKRRRK